MSTTVSDRLDQLLRRSYGGSVPSDLRILVHLSAEVSKASPGPCTATALEFPVSAKAETPEEAVQEALIDLLNYLTRCEETETFAPCWRGKVYQAAWSYGRKLELPKGALIVRVSRELERYLGSSSDPTIASRAQFRDIRYLQHDAGGKSIETLFQSVA